LNSWPVKEKPKVVVVVVVAAAAAAAICYAAFSCK